jgi:hypothetical protein
VKHARLLFGIDRIVQRDEWRREKKIGNLSETDFFKITKLVAEYISLNRRMWRMNNSDDYWKELRKQFKNMSKYTPSPEFIKVMNDSNAILQHSLTMLAQSGVVKAIVQMAEEVKNLRLSIPQETITNLRRIEFLTVLDEIEWPLYLVFSDDFMNRVNKRKISEDFQDLIFEYCNDEFLDNLENDWNNSSVIQKGRLPILKEAVLLYKNENYYGVVSVMMCQLMGIITDTYDMQISYGKDFSLDDITAAFENYNPGKNAKQCINTKNDNYKRKEKNQLLWFLSDAQEGFLYWIHAVKYIYNTILTSDDNMSESMNPCRNKICHGEQLNFGTKEHGLKSILTVDMMIRLAESLKKVNESESSETNNSA